MLFSSMHMIHDVCFGRVFLCAEIRTPSVWGCVFFRFAKTMHRAYSSMHASDVCFHVQQEEGRGFCGCRRCVWVSRIVCD